MSGRDREAAENPTAGRSEAKGTPVKTSTTRWRPALGVALGALVALAACDSGQGPGADAEGDTEVIQVDTSCAFDKECGAGRVCDPTKKVCVGCLVDADCPGGAACHPTIHACVQCVDDGDCASGVCETATATCVQCLESADCPSGVCHPDKQQCVSCLINRDCATGKCNAATHSCVGCSGSADCQDGQPCTLDTCGADGVCAHTPLADGTACDDRELCTAVDACVGGACVGSGLNPVCCAPIDCGPCCEAVDSDGGGCADACVCPEVKCSGGLVPADLNSDGCQDGCGCPEGPQCPGTSTPADSDGDGCVDTCEGACTSTAGVRGGADLREGERAVRRLRGVLGAAGGLREDRRSGLRLRRDDLAERVHRGAGGGHGRQPRRLCG